jgi:hypothetical protein
MSSIFGKPAKLVLILAASTAALLTLAQIGVSRGSQGQTSGRTRQTSAIDYSKFSHNTKKHQNACSACHKIPTRNWRVTSQFPDVSDFPGHDACVSCHRTQFFKGARPIICSVCHTKTSPRDDDRLEFKTLGRLAQFTTEFPHNKHQDVIATLRNFRVSPNTHHVELLLDEKYNNCSICHVQANQLPSPLGGVWPDNYVPDSLTFKTIPKDHSSCFNCHWKQQQPIASNCNGCHKLTADGTTLDGFNRVSFKFKHEGGGEKKNHVAECTTCHINITKSATVRGLKPDVPITSCSECHNKDGLRQDVTKELMAIDKNRDFVCVYCHTSIIGRQDPPASHYLIAERVPMKRKEVK